MVLDLIYKWRIDIKITIKYFKSTKNFCKTNATISAIFWYEARKWENHHI